MMMTISRRRAAALLLGAGGGAMLPGFTGSALATAVSGRATTVAMKPDTAQMPARNDMLGELELYYVQPGDTLLDIAMRYRLGFVELRSANPTVDPWLPEVGQALVLPTLHIVPQKAENGIMVNLGDLRLYFFPGGGRPVQSWPISTGREAYETPKVLERVTQLTRNPTWVPTKAHRAEDPTVPNSVPPGPDNPLGRFRVRVGWDGYAIHGTNKPEGIGRRVSRGCVRMYPDDIESLFDMAEVGMKVAITNQPVKYGWVGEDLYMEVHPNEDEIDRLENSEPMGPHSLDNLDELTFRAAGRQVGRVNWNAVYTAAEQRRGLPVRITRDV